MFQLKAVPYSRDYKRKYEFFRRKLKKQVSDPVTATWGVLREEREPPSGGGEGPLWCSSFSKEGGWGEKYGVQSQIPCRSGGWGGEDTVAVL